MTGRPTDHRNVDLCQLNLDVAYRRAEGRIIWQPRMLAWFSDREFAGQPLPAPYTGMSPAEVYRSLGCSDRLYGFEFCVYSKESPEVHVITRDLNSTDYEVVTETPVGSMRAVYRKVKDSPWHMPLKWPVSSAEELKVAGWREANRTWHWDQERYDKKLAEVGDLGAPHGMICRTTVQQLIVQEMGVEGATYALLDYPDVCEAYFEALNASQERQIEVYNACPIMLINFGDNVHEATLPPMWFEKYVLPTYQRRCELLHSAGKFVQAHWDGDCKSLLPYARETGLDGIEAITPKPQGDVTIEEIKKGLGDMFLVDGIPAVLFEDTYSEQELEDFTKRLIDALAPNLILGISDEIASDGDVERVRLVGRIVDDYNASL